MSPFGFSVQECSIWSQYQDIVKYFNDKACQNRGLAKPITTFAWVGIMVLHPFNLVFIVLVQFGIHNKTIPV